MKTYKRCFESHPELKVGKGVLVGGNCSSPVCHDADIYIGLDGSMNLFGADPWDKAGKPATNVFFQVTDGQPPHDKPRFDQMVNWVIEALNAGKKVHIGCIGGHGRTGTVLAVIASKMGHGAGAAKWVRENYCKKAMESCEQVKWLEKHYGIEKVEPSHAHTAAATVDWTSRYQQYGAPLNDTTGGHQYDDYGYVPAASKKQGGTKYAETGRGSRLDPNRQRGLFPSTKQEAPTRTKVVPMGKKKSIWVAPVE